MIEFIVALAIEFTIAFLVGFGMFRRFREAVLVGLIGMRIMTPIAALIYLYIARR